MTRLATAVFDPQGRRAGRFLAEHGTLYRGMPALLALGPPLLARTRVRHHQAEMHKSRLADAYVIHPRTRPSSAILCSATWVSLSAPAWSRRWSLHRPAR